ncbi:MAG: hypothetical protein WC721_07760 [Victivallaceae bacterium]
MEPGNQKAKKQSIVLNWTPKCRSEEARECGSEKWKARKARKVVNAGNAELGARMSGMIAKLKNIMLNDTSKCRSLAVVRFVMPGARAKQSLLNWTPKCRSEEARECGSVPRLRVPRMRERKARKVVNAGNAELGARMSGMIAKLKNIMFNDTPKCRSLAVVRFVMPGAWAKQSLLNWTPKCRSCSVVLAGRRCNGCPKQAMAVSGMKAGDVQNFGETIKPCCGGAFSLILECCDIFECG